MATARDIVDPALRRARLLASGQSTPAELSSEALEMLNEMVAEWALNKGVNLGLSTLALSDTLTVDAGHFAALRWNLALKMREAKGFPVTRSLQKFADESFDALAAAYIGNCNARFDDALTGRHRYNINEG